MNIRVALLKFLHPKDDEERMALRRELHYAQAQSEDVTRTIINMDATHIANSMKKEHNRRRGDKKINGD